MLRWKKHWRNKIWTPGCQPWDGDPLAMAGLVLPCQAVLWDGFALNTFSQQPRRGDQIQLHAFPGRIFPIILGQTPSGSGQTSPQRCRGCLAPFQGVACCNRGIWGVLGQRAAALSHGKACPQFWDAPNHTPNTFLSPLPQNLSGNGSSLEANICGGQSTGAWLEAGD